MVLHAIFEYASPVKEFEEQCQEPQERRSIKNYKSAYDPPLPPSLGVTFILVYYSLSPHINVHTKDGQSMSAFHLFVMAILYR